MKLKTLVLLNTITLVIVLFVNYATNSGVIGDTTVGEVSRKYDTLFAPAGYAFTIWGLIFLGNIAFVGFQWYCLGKPNLQIYIERTGWWFVIANLSNGLWVYCWLNEWLGVATLLIFVLLGSLVALTIRLRLELDDAPVRIIAFVWWPIAIYLGWLMVASIACVAAWLTSLGMAGEALQPVGYTIGMIIVATLLYIFLVFNRNLREAAAVGIWAFIAIAVRHANDEASIKSTAIIAAIILFVAAGYHGYKNRKFNIASKLSRNEWSR